jgi:hypothetical protein
MLNFPSFFNAQVGGYEIEHSLRFDGSSYLTRTSGSSGAQTFTLSFWSKKTGVANYNYPVFVGGSTTNNYGYINYNNGQYLTFGHRTGGSGDFNSIPNASYRDTGAWYHHVVVLDFSNATQGDRYRLYTNGVEVDSFSAQTLPSNTTTTTQFFRSGENIRIGCNSYNTSNFFDGYFAEFHCVYGSALDPDQFGEFDNNGVWRPIEYTGSHGAEGFYLKFDPSATNGIGHDHSGNGNNFTPTGFTVNPDSYVLATLTGSHTSLDTGTLRDIFDTNSGSAGGVYQQSTTGSTEASTINIEFSSALSGTITVTAADGTGSTNNGGQYQLIDSTDTVQVTQARPTTTTTFTHTGLSDITKLRMYGGSSGAGGILISRFESSDQTIRTADWLGEGDVLSDTPTTNYATINPLGSNASSYSEGNLKFVGDTANTSARGAICTQAVSSGKWYWEVTIDAVSGSSNVGVVKDAGLSSTSNTIIDLYYLNGAYSYAAGSGNKIEGFGSSVTSSSYGNTYTTNDIIGVALDLDNGAIYFAKNNTWQNSGDPTSGSSKTGAAFTSFSGGYAAMSCGAQNHTATFNFGQRDFAYTPPTGFKALNTSNLSAPTVKDGGDHFNTVLYTGDNLEQVITGVNFQPDWVWVKCRNQGSTNHVLQDAVRGAQKYLTSDTTVIEGTSNGTIISFDSDGFTIGAGNPAVPVNNNGDTFVAWNWKANGNGTSSNTDGSITSTVSANPSAGFSIVSYTGNGVNGATWGHGLGVAPDMVIVKRRNASYNWAVYHSGVDATAPEDYWMSLDTTNARASNTTIWGSTAPTSTTVKVGWLNETNANTGTYIAYCFAEVEGYSKFGSYTGNNSTDGPFVYCGFSVQWLMYKRSSAAEDWVIVDNSRDTYNVADAALRPNQSLPEFSNTEVLVDFTSNGFKIRSSDAKSNGSGSTYIFMALAENPFGGDGVSPATAR